MYEDDSFFTLSQSGQLGLLALTGSLFLVTVILVWWGAKRRPLIGRLILAFAAFALFVWVAPQVYYEYYRMIISGLPAQWVIDLPPGVEHLSKLLSFRETANLSNHAQGALGWVLVAVAILRRGPRVA